MALRSKRNLVAAKEISKIPSSQMYSYSQSIREVTLYIEVFNFLTPLRNEKKLVGIVRNIWVNCL